jgi:peroxiredoxin
MFAVKPGDKFPSAVVAIVRFEENQGFTNEIVDINEYLENKNVVLVGYPGCFTPTCMHQHIPQFIGKADEIKKKGAEEIIALSVNDPFVVVAFAELLGGRDKINFIADGNGELTKALGLDFDLTAVQLGPIRSKRFTMIVKNNRITEINSEEGAMLTEKTGALKILD